MKTVFFSRGFIWCGKVRELKLYWQLQKNKSMVLTDFVRLHLH